jgi:protoheme IX farnesyltransferase
MNEPDVILEEAKQTSWKDYLSLCKPKVVLVMLLTALVGMLLAQESLPSIVQMFIGLIGIALASGSAAAVNHVMDRKIDQKMARTKGRPLPQGKLTAKQAISFAGCIGVLGIGMLAVFVNLLTAWLTLFALIGYAVVYTVWLKRATPQNIVIGGLAGAAPPLLGWTAITGYIEPNSLLLVLIIFAWTPPHFWSLCIARKADYEKAGVPMLPVTHGSQYTRLQIVLYSLIMLLTTLFPYMTGMSGLIYLLGVSVINARFIYWVWQLVKRAEGAPMSLFFTQY